MMEYDVIILGGGASGMMAAITAGRREKKVLLLEKQEVLGRKLAATGNGKCNIFHDPLSVDMYYTDFSKRLSTVIEHFDTESTRMFFEGIGLSVYNKDGYVYPFANEAKSVVKCLALALEEAGVKVMTGFDVTDIVQEDNGFLVKGSAGEFHSKKLVIACGGPAGSQLGATADGFKFAKSFSHRFDDPVPALTDLYCDGLNFKKLKGLRMSGHISTFYNGELLSDSRGEIQFTEKGISGIAVFNVSYECVMCLKYKRDVEIHIDFFPEQTNEMLFVYLKHKFSIGRRSVEDALAGYLPEKFIPEILKAIDANGKKAARLSDEEINALVDVLKCTVLTVTGHGDFDRAQVTGNGVLLHDLTDELESDHVRGLYFCGEICDVNGICGGYNLQWAWSSGAVVGNAI